MTPAELHLTAALWRTTLAALAPYCERRVEGGCLLYGRREGEEARALVVGVPHQVNRARNFEIPADALAALSAAIPDGLIVVAQVHSHPGTDTTHSRLDDALMVSRRAFSLVLPRYAAHPSEPASAGVHIYDGSGWVKLTPAAARCRVIVDEAAGAEDGAAAGNSALVDMRW